jgi:hypothetical protein
MNKNFSPILLITFNRPDHTNRTLFALSLNEYANNSVLYCYIDGPRNTEDLLKQEKIINIIQNYRENFKSVKIIKRERNLGLAKNIIEAVTEVVSKHKKVIVLEDDIITSKAFLKFMNAGLEFYEREKRVWHISAHSEINLTDRKNEIFLCRVMDCWGWATWEDRWSFFEKDAEKLINEFTENMIYEFDLDGSGKFWNQVLANAAKKIDTWAIFWYATIFRRNGLCVNPFFSYVKNIGFDGSGVHCNVDNNRNSKLLLNTEGYFRGKLELAENSLAIKILKKVYAPKKDIRYFIIKTLVFFNAKNMIKKLLTKTLMGK